MFVSEKIIRHGNVVVQKSFQYALNFLFESKTIENNEFESLSTDCDELIRLLTSIIKSLKLK